MPTEAAGNIREGWSYGWEEQFMRKSIQVITMPWSCFSDPILYFYYKHCSLIISLLERLVFCQLIALTGKDRFKALWTQLKFWIRTVKVPCFWWCPLSNPKFGRWPGAPCPAWTGSWWISSAHGWVVLSLSHRCWDSGTQRLMKRKGSEMA